MRMRLAWSSWVPCEAFNRNTSTPASNKLRITASESAEGPSVATILVAGMRFKNEKGQGYATITKIHKLRGNRFSTSHYAALPGYLACHHPRSHGVFAYQQQRASYGRTHVDGFERSWAW